MNIKNNNFRKNKPKILLTRTKFIPSILYLCLQVFIPGLILYFLISKDFNFAFSLSKTAAFFCCLGLITFTILSTTITYFLKLHQIDQYTYAIPFAFAISAIILCSYFSLNNLFIRFILLIVNAIIGMILTFIALSIILKQKSSQIKD